MDNQIDNDTRKIGDLSVSEFKELIQSINKETLDKTLKGIGLKF